jgi:hypothetical protein
MAESSQHPLTPGVLTVGASRAGSATGQRALLTTLAIVIGSAILGIIGGLIWAAIAPQALFVVASHGVAYVVNPETSAFIAADGWFSIVGIIGGLVIGLAGYLFGARRYGPLPVAGVLVGATAASLLAWWTGRNIGLGSFRHQLGTSKAGTLLRQPADLGAHSALVFWPLAAGAVIAGIELMFVLRERRRRLATTGPLTSRGQYSRGQFSRQYRGQHGPAPQGPAAQTGLDGSGGHPSMDGHPSLDGASLDGASLDGASLDGASRDGASRDGQGPRPGPDGQGSQRPADSRQADRTSDQHDA